MADFWTGQWQDLAFRVEYRSLHSGGGATLRIGPLGENGDEAEWLRFDCFDENPHWHLAPADLDETHALASPGDSVTEVFEMLGRQLAKLLDRAGAPASIVANVDQNDGDERTAEARHVLKEAESMMRHRPIVFDDRDIRHQQARRSAKWHQYPADILPAWVAEMDFELAAPIKAEIERHLENSDLGYPLTEAETGLPDAFSERMNERFGWNPDPTRIEVLAEVVQGLYIAVEAYTEVGDSAIVQTPIYPPFLTALEDTGRRLVENPLVSSGDRFEFDFDHLAEQADPTTRLFLLCNPHNPSGRVMLRADLERIAAHALAHDLIVISDEIHADLLYDDHVHIPFASLGPEIEKRTVTLTSASKPFNIPGLRCAVAHFGSDDLQQRFNRLHPPRFRGGIGLLGVYATIAAWRWGQPWLDEIVPYLQANRDYAFQLLEERIPEIRFYPPESTYLAWLDCSALELKGSPVNHFMKHGRVALSAGARFGSGWNEYVRLNFATSRPILTEVIDRMAKALGR
jgi:cystathionine beta-lyase